MKSELKTDTQTPQLLDIKRRQFLKKSIGLSFALTLPNVTMSSAQAKQAGDLNSKPLNAYVSILPSGKIRIIQPAAEMGQGVHTSLPLIVAEELDANWDDVEIEISPSFGEAYGDPLFLNMIFTSASRNVLNLFDRLRIFGAQARRVLLMNAAQIWQLPLSELNTEPGLVIHRSSGRKMTYAEVAAKGSLPELMPEIRAEELKPVSQFRLIGKSVPRRQTGDKSSGKMLYSIDEYPPGTVFAAVVRAPIEGAKLASFDDKQAKQMPGVLGVYTDADEIAVVAANYWQARQAKNKLLVKWQNVGDVDHLDNESALKQHTALVQNSPAPGFPWDGAGDLAGGFKTAATVLEAEYQTDYGYHAAMEPLGAIVCVAEDGKSAKAWVGTQVPAYTIGAIAEITGINQESITLNRNVMGGGFGRRALYIMDYVKSAAWLSKRLHKPVKVTWDREDDLRYGFFRPLTAQKIRAGLDKDGNILAWHHRVACDEPMYHFDKPLREAWGPLPLITMLGSEHQKEDRTPLIDAYDLPNRLAEHIPVNTGIRIFAMRGVGASPNKFAIESFIDELAESLGKDPLEYRLQLLKQSSRGQAVLRRVAQMSDWDKQREGRALGIAYSYYGGSLTAAVSEISLDKSKYKIRVHNVWLAVDVGIAVQPDNVKAQYEGGVIYGLSNCLNERVNIKKGIVQQSNFHDYQLMRINEAPNIEVEVLRSEEKPTGVGELGTVIAPCTVANAFASLSGKRLRYMPFFPEQIKQALKA